MAHKYLSIGTNLPVLPAGNDLRAWKVIQITSVNTGERTPGAWLASRVLLIRHEGKRRPFRIARLDYIDGETPRIAVDKYKSYGAAFKVYTAAVGCMLDETEPHAEAI